MKPLHYSEIDFQKIEINGISALFTNLRVERKTLPEGYFAYDIRSDEDELFATIEPSVWVDHWGTILVTSPIEMEAGDCVEVKEVVYLDETVKSFQIIIDAYTRRLDSYFKAIDEVCQLPKSKNRNEMPVSPSYLKEVLIPVYEQLERYLQTKKRKIKVPDPNTYCPIKEYYRIKIGLTTVGGFCVPDGDDFSIYFTPLKSALPIGDKVKVETAEELGELILSHLKSPKEE